MALVGIRFMALEGDKPVVEREFKLAPEDPSRVIISQGQHDRDALEHMAKGVTLGIEHDLRTANTIAEAEGVSLKVSESKPVTFMPTDGAKFIVALLAFYHRQATGYWWTERIRDPEGQSPP